MKRIGVGLLCGWVLALGLGCGGGQDAATTSTVASQPVARIVIGRVPSGNPIDILERMEPLNALIEQKLGVTVDVRFAKDYSDFTDRMVRNDYDIAFCAPFQYLAGHEKAGYTAVLRPVRHGADTYVGIVITARPELKTLAQLKGKRVAFVDPNSTSGFLFPLGLLAANGVGLKDIHYEFLKGHDNVVLNVLSRNYDAGACFEGAEKAYGRDRSGEIFVLGRTAPIYNEPIAFSPKFRSERAELAARVIAFMIALHETPEGMSALRNYDANISRFVPATDADYDTVRLYRAELPASVVEGSGL